MVNIYRDIVDIRAVRKMVNTLNMNVILSAGGVKDPV